MNHRVPFVPLLVGGGRRVGRQREKRKLKRMELRVETLNVGTMTGKAIELVDILCSGDQVER